MKKLLCLLMLTALLVSCSSDDDNTEPNNGNGNNNGMIDENILGKWKVEHSKTIKGARFLEDGTLEIAEGAVITEYDGNFGELNVIPKSGIFDVNEYQIEIKSDNTIISTRANNNPTKIIYYKIKDDILYWENKPLPNENGLLFSYEHRYNLENGKLTIERTPTLDNGYVYIISEYSKVTK